MSDRPMTESAYFVFEYYVNKPLSVLLYAVTPHSGADVDKSRLVAYSPLISQQKVDAIAYIDKT